MLNLENLDTRKMNEEGKIRVRNISEMLKPEFITNNNSSKGVKHGEVIEIEDDSDEKDFDDGGIEHRNIEMVNDGCTPKPASKNIETTSMEWSISTYITMVKAAIRVIGGKKGCTIMDIRKYVCANYMVEDTETISSRLRLAIRKMLVTCDIFKDTANGVELYSRFPQLQRKEEKFIRWDNMILHAMRTFYHPNGCSRQDILQHVRSNNSDYSQHRQSAHKYPSAFKKAINALVMKKMLVEFRHENGSCSYTLPDPE